MLFCSQWSHSGAGITWPEISGMDVAAQHSSM